MPMGGDRARQRRTEHAEISLPLTATQVQGRRQLGLVLLRRQRGTVDIFIRGSSNSRKYRINSATASHDGRLTSWQFRLTRQPCSDHPGEC